MKGAPLLPSVQCGPRISGLGATQAIGLLQPSLRPGLSPDPSSPSLGAGRLFTTLFLPPPLA